MCIHSDNTLRSCQVLVPLPYVMAGTDACAEHGIYDYHAVNPEVGKFVKVPWGNKQLWGIVVGLSAPSVHESKLKKAYVIQNVLPVSTTHLEFLSFFSSYNLVPLGRVARLCGYDKFLDMPMATVYGLANDVPSIGITPKRQKVLDLLSNGDCLSLGQIADKIDVAAAVVRSMCKLGMLIAHQRTQYDIDKKSECNDMDGIDVSANHTLSDEQERVCGEIMQHTGQFKRFLLTGQPGAGKTEVYINVAMRMLCQGRQVFIMLPEISLTTQWVRQFEAKWPIKAYMWHSTCSKAYKREIFHRSLSGQPLLLIGTRSALFIPFGNLGLIVIDEEHDGSFKQQQRDSYNARDMSVIKALKERVPIVLVSATPSLESVYNAGAGKYHAMHLSGKYFDTKPLDVQIADMTRQRGRISDQLKVAMSECIDSNQQVLLFLNRRGYAPLLICKGCGDRRCCKNCSTFLVYHYAINKALCHLCGYNVTLTEVLCESCTECKWTFCGAGIERITQDISNICPDAKVVTISSEIGIERLTEYLDLIQQGSVDIIIATQIMSKGYHFPSLGLVGIIDADMGLSSADLRSHEQVFQLLLQVSGRAGREKTEGKVIIQTYDKSHPVITMLKKMDYEAWAEYELAERKDACMPPYSRIILLIICGPNQDEVKGYAHLLCSGEIKNEYITMFGPMPAMIVRKKEQYYYKIAFKAPRGYSGFAEFVWQRYVCPRPDKPNGIQVYVDVDPYEIAL